MDRIKVLRLIARMNVGGPALQVSGLTRHLDASRFEHLVLAGSVAADEADYTELRAPDVDIQTVQYLGRAVRPWDDLLAFFAVIRQIRRFHPDIVHTHTAKAGVLGRTAAWLCRVPITVHTFHGHLLHGYFSRSVTHGVRLLEGLLARRTTALVAVGGRVRDDLLAAGIGRAEQYTVVPPGVDLPPPPAQAAAREALELPRDRPVVAYVARLTEVKRPDRMLDVVRSVLSEVADCVFLVVGEGPLYETVRREAAKFGDSVHVLGWRGNVELVYAACDVVLLTSDNEGMPVSLIEAAHAGRPAVTTNVGSASEVVLDGRTGFVTDTDALALARRVVELLTAPELRRDLGAAASGHAAEAFSVGRLVGDTETLYERLMVVRQSG